MQLNETCHCPAYAFPHRKASGRCIWASQEPRCVHCGQVCTPVPRRETESTEFWGTKSWHEWKWVESDCCATECVQNGQTLRYEDV